MKFDKYIEEILNPSHVESNDGMVEADDGILVHPLSNEELEQLQAGNDITLEITPDAYVDRFKNKPYTDKETMEDMTHIYSKTMAGEFTFKIDNVSWDVDKIVIDVLADGGSSDADDEIEDDEEKEDKEDKKVKDDSEEDTKDDSDKDEKDS